MSMRRKNLNFFEMKKELNLTAGKIVHYRNWVIKDLQKRLVIITDREERDFLILRVKKATAELREFRRQYRYLHIAYCELRGIPREKIENPVFVKEINENDLQTIKDAYQKNLSL